MPKVEIYQREIPHNTCLVFETVERQFRSTRHIHRDFEIVFIQSGSGVVQYGAGQQPYQPGDLVILGPWIPHEFLEQSAQHHSISLLFNRDFLVTGFFNSNITQELRELLERAAEGMVFHADPQSDFALSLDKIKTEDGLMQAIHLLTLLVQLSRNRQYKIISQQREMLTDFQKNQVKSEHILQYINKHANRKLLLEEVAKHFGMSRSSFTRFFRTYIGMRFVTYLSSVRVQRACVLLQDCNEPIITISQDSGFDNISTFNRTFLQLTGKTPREYRRGTHPNHSPE